MIRNAYDMSEAENDPVADVLRAVLSLGRRLRAERGEGAVSLSGIAILATLHRFGAMPAARLAERERLQPQSLTRIVASLESQGLIERRRSEEDRREIVIAITAGGREALADDMSRRRAWLDRAMAQAVTPAEREVLQAAAQIMLKLAHYGDERNGA